jgi:carbon-monoxide dehydrogenase medium subunit
VEKILEGKEIDSKLIEECSVIVQEEISPISDIRASAEYRRHVASVLFKRAIQNVLAEGEI